MLPKKPEGYGSRAVFRNSLPGSPPPSSAAIPWEAGWPCRPFWPTPPLWKGAIFVSANPGLEHEEERAARRAKDAEWAVQCLSASWESFLKEWDAQGVFKGSPPPPDRSSLKPWRKSISRAFIDWSVGAQENLAPLLKQSPVPQLWIAGQRDAKFSTLARRMAGEQAVIIPHAGHRLPLETPERLAECLQPFILQNL